MSRFLFPPLIPLVDLFLFRLDFLNSLGENDGRGFYLGWLWHQLNEPTVGVHKTEVVLKVPIPSTDCLCWPVSVPVEFAESSGREWRAWLRSGLTWASTEEANGGSSRHCRGCWSSSWNWTYLESQCVCTLILSYDNRNGPDFGLGHTDCLSWSL